MKKKIKKITLILLGLIVLFVFYLIVVTVNFKSIQKSFAPVDKKEIGSLSVDRFREAIQIKTVSPEHSVEFDSIYFNQFNVFLSNRYPLVDSLLEKKTFNTYSHLYHWKGSNKSLKPIVLIAHLDVVPVIEENLADWKHNPFGGEVINDTIWGRGTIDDKIGVVGIMESVELLLKEGFQPQRGIYFAFGHDEEIGGQLGAKTIAQYLEEQNIKAELILDEGGSIVQKMVPNIEKDVALIGIAEKGFVSFDLSVKVEGGHSSMPEKETSIDILSKAIVALKQHPFPANISPPIEGFIKNLGPEMPFMKKMAFANSSIFKPIILSTYESSATGNALVRTTTAPTIFHSGVKENIIPQNAKATINFRILPGETIETVKKHIIETVNDQRVKIEIGNFSSNPSKVSSTEVFGYQKLEQTILEVYPETLTSPYLVIGATDSRHYKSVSDNIYRFLPIKLNKNNIKSFHGLNERIPKSEFESAILFYYQFIRNCTLDDK